jgi:hypothetical protein
MLMKDLAKEFEFDFTYTDILCVMDNRFCVSAYRT